MAEEKKGITVKIDAALHAEIRQFIEQNGMTMADFVSQALYNELHPKIQPQEVKNMGPTRTMAFQMPEDMFQRLKDYLHRHGITQKEFVLGLVEAEIKRDEELINAQNAAKLDETAENISDEKAEIIGEELEDIEEPDEDETEDEDFDEDMDDIEEPDEDEDLDDEETEDEDEELDDEESEDEDEEIDDEESEGEDEELSEEQDEDFSMAM
ncbi:hypothetical protein [Ruminococcus flavefaciens]|uniref:hypothetical protein n=1 Tax=Ruminococcus flavefaciens TaxID=1265 RepID=UPI0015646B9B|nr:hypothetical protein [Ruminococcus flavefaciens]